MTCVITPICPYFHVFIHLKQLYHLVSKYYNISPFNIVTSTVGPPHLLTHQLIRRVLLVDPREGNNNTNISCIAINTSPLSDDTSNTSSHNDISNRCGLST